MKKIALYIKEIAKARELELVEILKLVVASKVESVYVENYLYNFANNELGEVVNTKLSLYKDKLPTDTDLLICLGGDGTFLDSVQLLSNFDTLVLGINLGSLGFLANMQKEDLLEILKPNFDITKDSKYIVLTRDLLETCYSFKGEKHCKYALNEATLQKSAANHILNLEAKIDNRDSIRYIADGLIIATATGSTAYSMSAGGPIVMPNVECFIITPIAAHNLNIRPLIVKRDSEIIVNIDCTRNSSVLTIDSLKLEIDDKNSISFKLASFNLKVISKNDTTFVNILESKLFWALDKRNKIVNDSKT